MPRRSYHPVVRDRDHARPRTAPAPPVAAVEAGLTALVSPAALALGGEYRKLKLRDRILSLPVMVGVVLAMIWRHVPSVSTLVTMLEQEQLLWVPPTPVSQQALSLRLRTLPASLFAAVFATVLPTLTARTAARGRPQPAVLTRLARHYPRAWAVDGTTLEALFKKVGLLRDEPGRVGGGVLLAALDLATKLPVQLWLDPDPHANEKRFLPQLKAALLPGTLIVVDRGFYQFDFFDHLVERGCALVTRARAVAAVETVTVLHTSPTARDRVIRLGRGDTRCRPPMRLVEVHVGGRWRAYLTSVLDPQVLPMADVVALYGLRWRIEDTFGLTKRLLGVSYLWSGAANAVALQVWATWLLYAVLVDLSDAVADELDEPLEAISLEMVYRGLYHVAVAAQTDPALDPVAYLATHAVRLGVVKRKRPARDRDRLAGLPPELNL